MAACLADDDLVALARGERSLDDVAIEAHLAGCASCADLLAQLVRGETGAEGLEGRRLGRYRLQARIGGGAMGVVYRAHDEQLDRVVAVKVLRRGDDDAVGEARAAAAINHRHVVTVHDVGRADGLAFVVSELVEGETLRARLARGKLSADRVVDLARQLAEGLAAAHACGVVHRDLKPENLIVARGGTLKILDFGLVAGTPGYLAPELVRGGTADARSDLFSLGAVLFEMRTGRRAFAGASVAERIAAVLRDEVEIDDPVVRRLLEKDPARRFHSAADLAWTLAQPRSATRPSRRGFLVGAAGVAAGAAAWLWRPRPATTRWDFQPLSFRHGRIGGARFTPDGGSLIYGAAWDEAPVSVSTSRVDGGGGRELGLADADVLAVSPRGELAIVREPRAVQGFHVAGRLAVLPLEGDTRPRELGAGVQHADFAPDGSLAATRGEILEWPLGREVLRGGWLSDVRVSPDGRHAAVLRHESAIDDRGELVLVDRAGAVRRIAGPFSSAAGVAWGDGVVWVGAARRGAGNAVRAFTLDGGEGEVVQATGRLRLLDARDGRLAVSQDTWRMRLMVGTVDRSLSDISMVTAMTPDGATIAFAELGDASAQPGVHLRPTAGGPATYVGPGLPLALHGEHVLAARLEPLALVEYSTRGGEVREVPLPARAIPSWAGYAGGARWLIVDGQLWRGETKIAPASSAALSSDGRVAMIEGSVCRLLDGAVVAGDFAGQTLVAWHADGESLWIRDRGWPVRLRRVTTNGATLSVTEIAPPALGRKALDTFVCSADGATYAYSYGYELGQIFLLRRS